MRATSRIELGPERPRQLSASADREIHPTKNQSVHSTWTKPRGPLNIKGATITNDEPVVQQLGGSRKVVAHGGCPADGDVAAVEQPQLTSTTTLTYVVHRTRSQTGLSGAWTSATSNATTPTSARFAPNRSQPTDRERAFSASRMRTRAVPVSPAHSSRSLDDPLLARDASAARRSALSARSSSHFASILRREGPGDRVFHSAAAAVIQAVRIALIHREFRPLLFAIGLVVVVVLAIQLQDRSG